jgi:GT2 family glycosyltransferase
MSRHLDVSVVISNHNTRDMLRACLQSVLQDLDRSSLSCEVIVVDDASEDGSADMVASQFPRVTLLRNIDTRGYAKTNNTGIRAASGAAVLLLNSDTVVLSGSIAGMYNALHCRPETAAAGPTLLNPDGTVQRSCWLFPIPSLIGNTLLLFRLGLWDDYRSWDHRVDREVDWISSAALMIRTSAVQDVGLFDEQFWVYGVDVDWAMRARRKGYRYLSLERSKVIHCGGASWAGALDRMSHDHMQSQDRLFRKHYGMLGLILYKVVVLMTSAVRLVFWGIPYLLGRRGLGPKVAYFRTLIRWTLRSGGEHGQRQLHVR